MKVVEPNFFPTLTSPTHSTDFEEFGTRRYMWESICLFLGLFFICLSRQRSGARSLRVVLYLSYTAIITVKLLQNNVVLPHLCVLSIYRLPSATLSGFPRKVTTPGCTSGESVSILANSHIPPNISVCSLTDECMWPTIFTFLLRKINKKL